MRTLQELHTARVTTDSDSGGLAARQALDLRDPGFNRAAALVEGFRVKPLGERGIGRPSIYARAAALAAWRPSPASSVPSSAARITPIARTGDRSRSPRRARGHRACLASPPRGLDLTVRSSSRFGLCAARRRRGGRIALAYLSQEMNPSAVISHPHGSCSRSFARQVMASQECELPFDCQGNRTVITYYPHVRTSVSAREWRGRT
jgi:hypothetical protein